MTMSLLHIAKACLIAAALLLAPAAFATPQHGVGVPGRWHGLPELDPAAGGAIVALLAGGALHIADRRRSRNN